jgi:hypothetical protein
MRWWLVKERGGRRRYDQEQVLLIEFSRERKVSAQMNWKRIFWYVSTEKILNLNTRRCWEETQRFEESSIGVQRGRMAGRMVVFFEPTKMMKLRW